MLEPTPAPGQVVCRWNVYIAGGTVRDIDRPCLGLCRVVSGRVGPVSHLPRNQTHRYKNLNAAHKYLKCRVTRKRIGAFILTGPTEVGREIAPNARTLCLTTPCADMSDTTQFIPLDIIICR